MGGNVLRNRFYRISADVMVCAWVIFFSFWGAAGVAEN